MKDESKAKWPDKLIVKERTAAPQWTSLYIYDESDDSYQLNVLGDTKDIAEYRAKQIAALPDMVALLKELCDYGGHYDCRGEWISKFAEMAESIRKKIGEVE